MKVLDETRENVWATTWKMKKMARGSNADAGRGVVVHRHTSEALPFSRIADPLMYHHRQHPPVPISYRASSAARIPRQMTRAVPVSPERRLQAPASKPRFETVSSRELDPR